MRNKTTENYNMIGLMSGTSLDGLDIAYCEFALQDGKWQFDLKASRHIGYSDEMRIRLKEAIDLSALDLLELNTSYGSWLGENVKDFIQLFDARADYIASHGHTVHHQPERGITFQLGDGQQLANVSGLTVIGDFRSKDVSLGGQGAPLVPIGDKYLFPGYDFCLNLGGISNISFDKEGKRIAYDIGLANILLNYLTVQIDLTYDQGGQIAASGTLNKSLFQELNDLAYYKLPFPKSTGYEWFVEAVIPLLKSSTISTRDKLCTSVHHIAYSIAREVKKVSRRKSQMLVTGGGAKNHFLVSRLREYLGELVTVHIPPVDIIDYKEAIVFGLLGTLRLRNEVNCLSSVTGASRDSTGGIIYKV
ncbi:MAG: anhydro-N-acetylmuramic acid kinase [Bacteroidota bacterium]